MKVSTALALLSSFDSAIVAAAGLRTPSPVLNFCGLFAGHEDETLSSFVNTLTRLRDARGRGANTPPIANLREALARLEACLRAANAKKSADEMASLTDLLDGCGHASVSALVSDARGWILEESQAKSQSASSRRGKKKNPSSASTQPPADYASLLKQASTDNVKFDRVIEQLREDRNIKTSDMREVARVYLGYELAKKKGRQAALMEIIERQAVDARQDARASLLDRLKPW